MSSPENPTLRSGRPQKEDGLKNRLEDLEEELAGIELRISQVEQLQTMASGLDVSKKVLVPIEGSEDAMEKIDASVAAIRTLEEEKKSGLAALLERRRQVKQLMMTGKMDLEAGGSEQEQ